MTAQLFGAAFSTGTAGEVLAQADQADRTHARLIVTANLDHVVELSDNAAFRKAYTGAAVRTLDGMPLVWLARCLGMREAVRVTGHDLLAAALERMDRPGERVYLICANTVVASRMRARFVEAGLPTEALKTAIPPLGFEQDKAFCAALARAVRAHGTTLLILGVGAPKSEIWVDRHAVELGSPLCLAIGEAVNVAAGTVPRAPEPMQRLGFEWLFRFAHAPRRLFARYFVRSWRIVSILARPASRTMLAPEATQTPVEVSDRIEPTRLNAPVRPAQAFRAGGTVRADAAARRRSSGASSRR